MDMAIAKYSAGYPKGPLAYFKYIQAWRTTGQFEGVDFTTRS